MFLIGSNKKAHYRHEKLQDFHIGIDLMTLMIHNLVEEEDV